MVTGLEASREPRTVFSWDFRSGGDQMVTGLVVRRDPRTFLPLDHWKGDSMENQRAAPLAQKIGPPTVLG
jgi:hypothetical protein